MIQENFRPPPPCGPPLDLEEGVDELGENVSISWFQRKRQIIHRGWVAVIEKLIAIPIQLEDQSSSLRSSTLRNSMGWLSACKEIDPLDNSLSPPRISIS